MYVRAVLSSILLVDLTLYALSARSAALLEERIPVKGANGLVISPEAALIINACNTSPRTKKRCPFYIRRISEIYQSSLYLLLICMFFFFNLNML